jgi:dTDP-4-dehydrorhamnose reductase
MKIFVLGYKGMLGRYVYSFLKLMKYNVIGMSRDEINAAELTQTQLRAMFFMKKADKGDVVVNCIGAIKPMVDKHGTLNAIKVNAIFPHLLSNVCKEDGYHMLHISTDCVFSGNEDLYDENSPHNCTDVYGKTKSLGEPPNCTTVRTSIIGEEIGTTRSLIEWIKSMRGKTANGFTNHTWNGLTCLQMAKVFEDIIANNKYWNGVRHIHSPNILKKSELVQMVSDIYDLDITVNCIETPAKCNRSLASIYDNPTAPGRISFEIPDIESQIEEQFYYFPTLMSELL